MRRKPLLWRLFPSYLIVILASLLAIAWYTSRTIQAFNREQITGDLEARARLASRSLDAAVRERDIGAIDSLCKQIGAETGTRITVMLPDGDVAGDSHETVANMDNHAGRPEMQLALSGQPGHSVRYSHTLDENMMYVALPMYGPGGIVGVVRSAIAANAVNAAMSDIRWSLAVGGLLVAMLAAGISLLMARWISRPLEEMTHGAERVAQGDLDHRLPIPTSKEMAGLAEAMNLMVAQLNERINEMNRQSTEQEAILSSMVEGVVAVDTHERVISINQAARRLLGIRAEMVHGRALREAVPNVEIRQFVVEALTSPEPVEREIVLHDRGDEILQVQGTLLRDGQGAVIGGVVVLHDVTRLRRLEQVRRDFVANVSHELKTPITTIKGFVETILDGGLESPELTERFLRIIEKHANRLNAIIEDLLALSHIEQGDSGADHLLEPGSVRTVLEAAVQLCIARAGDKGIHLDLECGNELRALMNPPLLEQAVANLVENAIKYSEPGSRVHLSGHRENGSIRIRVADQGCGIPPEHLPRLFERFYRVDKARSRRLGGTGLGLAIVKHIAQAHDGHVYVESEPGEGSTFTIELPA